jgi:hypothetical protein
MKGVKSQRDRRGCLQPNRRGKLQVNVHFSSEVREAIREVAARDGVTMKDIITEAIRDLLVKRGEALPPELKPR